MPPPLTAETGPSTARRHAHRALRPAGVAGALRDPPASSPRAPRATVPSREGNGGTRRGREDGRDPRPGNSAGAPGRCRRRGRRGARGGTTRRIRRWVSPGCALPLPFRTRDAARAPRPGNIVGRDERRRISPSLRASARLLLRVDLPTLRIRGDANDSRRTGGFSPACVADLPDALDAKVQNQNAAGGLPRADLPIFPDAHTLGQASAAALSRKRQTLSEAEVDCR